MAYIVGRQCAAYFGGGFVATGAFELGRGQTTPGFRSRQIAQTQALQIGPERQRPF